MICVFLILVAINVVPVKSIGRLENKEGFLELDCTYMSDGKFYTHSKSNDIDEYFENNGEPFECVVDIVVGNPLDVLRKEDFNYHYYNNLSVEKRIPLNRFYLYGNVISATSENGTCSITYSVNKWSFYNSVDRLSVRKYFVPNDWLTLIDFDVLALIRRSFCQ